MEKKLRIEFRHFQFCFPNFVIWKLCMHTGKNENILISMASYCFIITSNVVKGFCMWTILLLKWLKCFIILNVQFTDDIYFIYQNNGIISILWTWQPYFPLYQVGLLMLQPKLMKLRIYWTVKLRNENSSLI